MKFLITGCAGFIGFHLTDRLLAAGHDVVGVDNLNDYYDSSLKLLRLQQLGIKTLTNKDKVFYNDDKRFVFIKEDIVCDRLYSDYIAEEQFDVICHFAAQAGVRNSIEHPRQYISANVNGFFNILEFCRYNPPKQFVFASSSSIYGKNEKMPYCESDATEKPVSFYAATKKSNELFAHSYSELYGLNVVGLRFFTVYGPWGRPDMAPFIFTKSILEGKPIQLFNGGNMLRDFTYIDDAVEGICKVLFTEPLTNNPDKYRIYNVGCSSPVNLNDFIGIIERLTGKKAQIIEMPMQPGDVKATWADVSLLQKDYGYAPKTTIETGLKEFIDWYKLDKKIVR
jgi:UDP-glucuronate 4-epimerase